MLPYIFHISILIAIFYLVYRLLWEKETFFQLNRWILITCLLLSFGLPWLPIPQEWSLQNRVVQQKIPQIEVRPALDITPVTANIQVVESKHPDIIKAEDVRESILKKNSDVSASEILSSSKTIPTQQSTRFWETDLTIWQVLQYAYFIGLAIFIINFLIQLALIFFQKATNPKIKDGRYTIVEMNQDKAPFSFGKSIFINPTKYDWDTYNQILAHEKIHIEQGHTIDILLAELVVIFQWFNPFAWLYRKAVENNLEYLTDYKMLHQGTERESYQLNLLRVSVPQFPLNLTTNYNQSFLKKRIAMMNVKKSSASSSWKYLLLLPLLALTVITLNPVQLKSQEPAKKKKEKEKSSDRGWIFSSIPPPPPPPPPPPAPRTPNAPPSPPPPPTPPSISRTSNSFSRTIIHETSGDGEGSNKSTSRTITMGEWTSGDEGKEAVQGQVFIDYQNDDKGLNINGSANFEDNNLIIYSGKIISDGKTLSLSISGNWVGDLSRNEACIQFMQPRKYNDYHLSMNVCFKKNELNSSPTNNAKGPFKLKREAGTLELNGAFEDGDGFGKYAFVEDANFRSHLSNEGFSRIKKDLMFHIFIADINKGYLAFLEKEGYLNISNRDLEDLAHHQMSQEVLQEYLEELKRLDFDKPTLRGLIQLAIHDVSVDYINKMGRDLFKDLTIKEVVEASIHDINPNYIKEIIAMGYDDLSFKEIVEFSIHDIDPDYIKELKDSGLNLSKREIVEASIHDVNANFIKEMRALGYGDLRFSDIIEFSIHDVNARYVKELKDSGLDLTKSEIVQAAIHDVDADFIKEMRALGYGDLRFSDIVEFSIHDVNARYIKELKDADLDLTKNEIVQATIHDVDANFIKEVRALGYDDLRFKDIVEFSIHGVNTRYIKSLKEAGLKNLTKQQIVEAAIHDIDADFLKEFENLDFDDLTFREIIELGIHDVDANYVKNMNELGYGKISTRELTDAKIHDVTPNYIKSLNDLGFKDIPMRKLIELNIHNVSPSFIKKIKNSGSFKDLTLDDYIEMKIHGRDRKMKRRE